MIHWVENRSRKRRERLCTVILTTDMIAVVEETRLKGGEPTYFLVGVIPIEDCDFCAFPTAQQLRTSTIYFLRLLSLYSL